ncbi:hypothetical protein [Spartinivicinus poritis]|uniref:Uncharacterized protein n=1 Tax=Spartinivicinus poritis TaxID=2994640 RepID=A0ABT5U4U7_9GAMM|nr:hypothetical protein [Spartinivicinus sp. A2-2]MDE1461011.1 hypothetical protein [Spartinivicinus sp. A2-2]
MSTFDKQVEENLQQEIRNNEQVMDELKELLKLQFEQLDQLKQQGKQLGLPSGKEDLTPVQRVEYEKQMAAFCIQFDHDETMIKSHSRAKSARVFNRRPRGLRI